MGEPSLNSFPDLMVWKLFNKLSPADRCALASCNNNLLSFIDSPHVWRDVTFVLDWGGLKRARCTFSRIPLEFIEKLSLSDYRLISNYQQHFRNVRIIISSGYIQKETFTVLSKLCERGVVKSVHIRVDQFVPNVLKRGGSAFEISGFYHNLFKPQPSVSPSDPPTIVKFLEQLEPDADLTLTFPVFFENRVRNGYELFYKAMCNSFYWNSEKVRFSSLLKTLILPTYCAYYSTYHIILMINGFPNLQEIHVNISNLSDGLLVALYRHGVSKGRTPLHRLVIRHVNKERIPFPQLSSKAWLMLTQSSPSLAVECYVVTDSLPQLDNVIKPETPLVKLKVICTSSDKPNILQLYSLCKSQSSSLQHFHLSISHDEEDLHLSYPVKKALKDMVGACTKLQHLVLGVEACCMTLVELATSGRQWRTFQYNLEAIACCKGRVVCTNVECTELDCSCCGALRYKRIEEATGFPYSAVPVEDIADRLCPVDAFNAYTLQPQYRSTFSPS